MDNPSKKLRILAIHGYAQSDGIFMTKLGSLRKGFKRDVEFVFVNGKHKVSLKNNFGIDESVAEGAYGWWFNDEDHIFRATVPSDLAVGFDESVALIVKTFEKSGPFDGVLGFSQGAAFAVILCLMQQKSLLPIKFDFAIIISGFKSLCKPHATYYDEKVNIPSLHIYGMNDRVIPTAMAEEVSEMFVHKTNMTHEGGHYIPSKKEYYKDFILEMLSNKNK